MPFFLFGVRYYYATLILFILFIIIAGNRIEAAEFIIPANSDVVAHLRDILVYHLSVAPFATLLVHLTFKSIYLK